jgi:hypothetical protein
MIIIIIIYKKKEKERKHTRLEERELEEKEHSSVWSRAGKGRGREHVLKRIWDPPLSDSF